MTDKEANTYCGKCIKADVCGMEGVYDPATTYCAYRVEAQPHEERIRRLLQTLVDNGCITAIQANHILKEGETNG